MKNMDASKVMEAQELERYAGELDQHQAYLDKQLVELAKFSEDVKVLEKTKEKEIHSPLGKGVYIPAQITDTKLLVEVGAGVLVKKTPAELDLVLRDQMTRLSESKAQVSSQLELVTQRLQEIMSELSKQE